MEHSVLGAAVPFRGEQTSSTVGGDSLDQRDVGLLAGFQHAMVGVDGASVGDHPHRYRAGAASGVDIRRPGGFDQIGVVEPGRFINHKVGTDQCMVGVGVERV